MKNLTIAFLATASLLSVSACKKKGGGAGEAMAKMGEFADEMCKCKDKACADKVQESMTKWSADMAANAPKDQATEVPSEADKDKMRETSTKLAGCMSKAMGAGDAAAPPAAAPPAAAAGGGDLPAECADYKAAIESLAKCDKLPQATRDALKQSYEQTSTAWASIPAEGKAALGTACKAAADAVKQSAAACN